jgi:purine-nucleoside phosphorylase
MVKDKDRGGKHSNKLEDDVVIKPRASRLDPKIFDPVILCPVGPLTALMARTHGAKKKWMPFEPARVYTINLKGRRVSLVGPAMGAPAATFVLERLIAAGAKRVIMLGLCGSIRREVKIGHLVVPMGAGIEEGVSRHYVSNTKKAYPGGGALEAVREAVKNSGKSFHQGPVWTIDAVFRETKKKVLQYGERGILAVEMEASALFTVAAYREIELAALLVVSDELFDLRWRTGFTRPRFLSACRVACRIALDAALRLGGGPGRAILESEKSEPGSGTGAAPEPDAEPEDDEQ